ncbi:hypothetical protein PAXRUDRAFT_140993 [Paxillus rubicundulus Ve08.2h10]|uniref:Telomere length regulation protein conserved domain-containing protein n=1 Tax=Paxillus rubicundulus Ve08.2h10 TaxID=930991 RepID=A0A0D0E8X4_9AGAM|nr:hypothetical protein PAXRUDRAFT_140993 [Paxillus rubicundulus Ve08.2h10]
MPENVQREILQDVVCQLQSDITEFQTLLPLLSLPLAKVGLLPPHFSSFNSLSNEDVTVDIPKVFPQIQRILFESILPTWETTLEEEGCYALALQYFCPDASSSSAGKVALCAYSTILSSLIRQRSVDILLRLAKEYPLDRLFWVVCSIRDPAHRYVCWDDCLRDVFAVPSKIANALQGRGVPVDVGLPNYYNNLSARTERLIYALSKQSVPGQSLPPTIQLLEFLLVHFAADDVLLITQLLSKLANVGAFPGSPYLSPSQSSFYRSTLQSIRHGLKDTDTMSYQKLWNRILSTLPSMLTQQAILASLFSSLSSLELPLSACARDRGVIRREAIFLRDLVGDINPHDDPWDSVLAVMLGRSWSENHSRVFVCWFASCTQYSAQALRACLSRITEVWSAPEHITHSLLSRHQYISMLLVLVVTHFRPSSEEVTSLAHLPAFISAVGTYISHLDGSVRRCGMLVAEVVATRAGKNLDFGGWEGDEDGKEWARNLRQLCSQRDVDFEPLQEDGAARGDHEEQERGVVPEEITRTDVRQEPVGAPAGPAIRADPGYDSDDSLTGYASPSSARSVSPTPSELGEIEKDPTLRIGVKRIPRPVYLAQLGEFVRSSSGLKSSEESQEADKIEMSLNVGEELIRRKRDYGTELAENTANLVYGFGSLNNNFDLDDFDDKRQRIMVALVACCPRVAAGCVIEEFFKNQYSTEQRFAMLNALALGARELASLPVYSPDLQPLPIPRTAFPSRTLPPALHQKYLAIGPRNHVQLLLDGIAKAAIDKGQEASAGKVPSIVRERQLRIRKPGKVTEVPSGASQGLVPSHHRPLSATVFTDVAAEFFIMPLINRFWVFLRDEQTREDRTAQRDLLYQYRGAGTGLILNPIVLAQFLTAMAILVHASQNAPQWLALIAPDALELAVTIGSRQLTKPANETFDEKDKSPKSDEGKEASVLTSALDLSLIILDGCLELDGGRSLGLEHTALLIGVGDWAGHVFGLLEKGVRVEGGGGIHEVKLRRAVAGVILKVDELTSKWRRSMVDIR